MNELFDEKNAGPALMEVDRLLSDFYRAQLPHPWPALRLPRPAVRRSVPGFAHNMRRLALAASVMLALGAYWALAGTFAHSTSHSLPGGGPELNENNLKHNAPVQHLVPMERQRTPAGNDVQIFQEDTPSGGIVINVIGPSNSKGPR
jgi:hypothetical protein